MIIRRPKVILFFGGLGTLTLLALLANIPETNALDGAIWLFFAVLVGAMLNLGTILGEGIVSPAPTAALMAFLTLGRGNEMAAALWSVAVGSLVGNVIWLVRTLPVGYPRRHRYSRLIRNITTGTAQLTLSLWISGWLYRKLGGRLPLDQLGNSDLVPLAALVGVYLLIYLDILLLGAYLYRRRSPRQMAHYWQEMIGVILLPLPFAVLGAVAYHALSHLAFEILIMGLLIVVAGVYLINRTQARYQQQVLELSSLSTVSQAMQSNLDLNALLDVIYRQTIRLLDASNFTVVLYDTGRNILHFSLNIQNHLLAPLPPREAGKGLIEYVIQEKTPLLIPDQVPQQARAMGLTPPPMPVHSWLGVPLLAPERVLGCMVVYSSRPSQHFTPNDLDVLTTIAGQAGIAIDNAQLYGQARDRAVQLATLNNIATILSGTLDTQQILDRVGSWALAVAGCDAVALYMWEGTQRPLALARHNGLSEAFAASLFSPLLLDIDDLQRRRQPLIVTDVQIDQRTGTLRAAVEREQKRAWIEFLLRKGDDLLGVLVCLYNEPRSFGPEEIELLRNFTNQAALAISNARLYTQTDAALNRRVEQLSALADISRELTSILNLQGLFELVLDRALEATQSQTGVLLLRIEDADAVPSPVAVRGFTPDAFDQITLLVGYIAQTYRTGQPTLVRDLLEEPDFVAPDATTRSQLNVPILRGDDVLGVIALGSIHPADYGSDDLAFVTQLAAQASIAIENARLFRRIEIARDRLQIILDSMKEAVVLIGAEGRITLANPRVKFLLGLDPQQIMNVPLVDLIDDPVLGIAGRLGFGSEALLSLVRGLGEGWWDESTRDAGRITFQIATPKVRFLDRTDAPIRDERGRVLGLLMVFADVTEERELAQARDDLSSMIVHDLRGPLTAVTTSLTLLKEMASSGDPLGKAVIQTTDMSSRAVRKLLNLVNSLLDVYKLESGVLALEREPTVLLSLCRTVIDDLAPLAQEMEVSLTLDVPDDLPVVDTDADKIERVLLNLVDNAIKFIPAGGEVMVRASLFEDEKAPHRSIRVEVEDTGPGIPDDFKERLFDRFTQLDGIRGRRRGTGLGLTYCRLAVEAHGGRIWVEDNPHGGAIFAFTLPVIELDDWKPPDAGEVS